ncbi:MAG: hypothetical protein ACE5GT_02690 [Rhodospirillales bacterium]
MTMVTAIKTAAGALVMALVMAAPASADPLPTVDWGQLEDLMQGTGDHVVGEELCARPR